MKKPEELGKAKGGWKPFAIFFKPHPLPSQLKAVELRQAEARLDRHEKAGKRIEEEYVLAMREHHLKRLQLEGNMASIATQIDYLKGLEDGCRIDVQRTETSEPVAAAAVQEQTRGASSQPA